MIRLLKATVHKYKCIEQEQSFAVEKDITVLVGMKVLLLKQNSKS
ncbi:MAG: hypothetical protein UH239_09515 [Acutalibacteraceae bacterium]|nr:hypothetical protein [Acutalibacteraceae bacterium]